MVSWVALRARCRCCDERISMMYPAIELLVGIGWLSAVQYFGPSFTALRVAVFGTVLLGVAMTDAKHYLIPDGFTLFGLIFALATAYFEDHTCKHDLAEIIAHGHTLARRVFPLT